MYLNFFVSSSIFFVVLILAAFGLLQWLHIPAGNFLDWIIGGASFWWLLVIVTVPWNVYFQAKAVLAEGEQSREKGILVDNAQQVYVTKLAKRSLIVALVLHLLSAIGLYTLAITGVSAVGYISSGAALLLTGLRPAVSAYEYLYTRLTMIRQEWQYPREDVVELRSRVEMLEQINKQIQAKLDPELDESIPSKQKDYIAETRRELAQLAARIEQLRANNETAHEQLSRENRQAIAQLSTDGQFLDHVREIIRFFKQA